MERAQPDKEVPLSSAAAAPAAPYRPAFRHIRYVPIEDVTRVDLFTSFSGRLCPTCTDRKPAGVAFCRDCWIDLPRGLQLALQHHEGEEYAHAVRAACRHVLFDRCKVAIPAADH